MISSSIFCKTPSRSTIETRTVRGLSWLSILPALPSASRMSIVSAVSDSVETASKTAVSMSEVSSLAKLAVTVPAPKVPLKARVNSATPAEFVRVLPLTGSMVAISLVRLIIRDSMLAVSDVVVSVAKAVTGDSSVSSVVGFPAASRSSNSRLKPPSTVLAASASTF